MNYPAQFTMHTPQGPTHCCQRHATMVRNLFQFLGAYTNATQAPDGAECANCLNEAAAKAPPPEREAQQATTGEQG